MCADACNSHMGQCNTNATLLLMYNEKQANNIADMQSADAMRYTARHCMHMCGACGTCKHGMPCVQGKQVCCTG